VVGYARATADLPEGAVVEVDGDSGQVTIQPSSSSSPSSSPSDPSEASP
jgi:hypothetical protein